MTALQTLHVHLGGDPQGLDAFEALQQELAKMNHPACPDVDWSRVEALCLQLFECNGVELYSAVAFVSARACQAGLAGMQQGLGLLLSVIEQWPHFWPAQASLRSDLLAGLFVRLQALLRASQPSPAQLAALATLLERLVLQLQRFGQPAPVPLQALRQQVALVRQRGAAGAALAQPWIEPLAMAPLLPEPLALHLTLQPPARRRWLPWVVMVFALLAVGAGLGGYLYTSAARQQPPALPVELDSLSLFAPGSAELRPDATAALVPALVAIKARPGWLIVISGHSDASGDAAANLTLSRARATAVRDWLQRLGDIPPGCFAVQGLAASQPLLSNADRQGRAANRRVEIRLLPQPRACGEPTAQQST